MYDWDAQLLSTLQARDRHEKASEQLYAAYTKLAEKVAVQGERPSTDGTAVGRGSGHDTTPTRTAPSQTSSHGMMLKLRQDLSEAQRSRKLLETRLQFISKDLSDLRIQSALDTARVADLSKERDQLIRRVRDRDEELKGKTKLLEGLHDETLSLTLQLNLADERRHNVESENEQLVERWMKRMGEEANQMNKESNFS